MVPPPAEALQSGLWFTRTVTALFLFVSQVLLGFQTWARTLRFETFQKMVRVGRVLPSPQVLPAGTSQSTLPAGPDRKSISPTAVVPLMAPQVSTIMQYFPFSCVVALLPGKLPALSVKLLRTPL